MESLTPNHIEGHDVPEHIYRAAKDWAASDLKYGITNGLKALEQKKFGKDNPPSIVTPAMRVGSMVHCFCLEPKSFPDRYALLDDKRSKEGKKLALQLAESGRETFTTAEMTQFMGIYNALSRNDFAKNMSLMTPLVRQNNLTGGHTVEQACHVKPAVTMWLTTW